MTAENVDALRRAGCAEAWLGVESGSQAVLDAMDKGLTVDDVRGAVARLRAAGIRIGFFLQFGYPGEGWPEIEMTRRLVRELAPDDIGVSVSYPLPGHGLPRPPSRRSWATSATGTRAPTWIRCFPACIRGTSISGFRARCMRSSGRDTRCARCAACSRRRWADVPHRVPPTATPCGALGGLAELPVWLANDTLAAS